MMTEKQQRQFALHTITRNNLHELPDQPGVYAFKDAAGILLYIGKAQSLRSRVRSYFHTKDDWKVNELLREHAGVSYIITEHDIAASLLEAELIQAYQPRYNVLLRSGDPFVYIMFDYSQELPCMQLVRRKPHGTHYFGPFIKRSHARRVFNYLQRTFQLKVCHHRITGGCLDYHLGRCAGNCADTFDKEAYITRLTLAEQALAGNHDQFTQTIEQRIAQHNAAFEFEKAAHLYAYLNDLQSIFSTIRTQYNAASYEKEVRHLITPHFQQTERITDALEEIQNVLGFAEPPRTIDCFDISHFQSTYIVGACIRFTDGLPDKQQFRRFKVSSLARQDDYAALREIVHRRYKKDHPPHLVVIDGGKGQRNAIANTFAHLYVVSIAKREERLFTPHHPDGFTLDIHSTMGQLLIALRDYTHHFAITYHRKRRSSQKQNKARQ